MKNHQWLQIIPQPKYQQKGNVQTHNSQQNLQHQYQHSLRDFPAQDPSSQQ